MSHAPTAPPGNPPPAPRARGAVRRRAVRTVSLLLLLVGLAGYASAAAVLLMGLHSPAWWSWLWLAVPATLASLLVLPLARTNTQMPSTD